MKRLDRYIIRKFLGTFFFVLLIIMLLASVFDISERIEDFLRTKPPLSVILIDYYQNFIYFYSNQFSALIIFISVIFFTSKLAQNSEVIAILSSGVGFNRFLRPYLIAATVLTLIALYSNHFVLPHANKKLIEFEAKYVWNKPSYTKVHREMEKGTVAYLSSYVDGRVDNLWIEKWNGKRLSSIIYATRAHCDSTSNKWVLEDYYQRIFESNGEKIKTGSILDTTLSFNVQDFGLRTEYAFTMTSPNLYEFINVEKQKGNEDIISYELELHQRTAFPLATYILTIIAVCVSCRKKRGGLGVNIAIGLLVAAFFIFMMKITSVAATNAGLAPALAVWIPNFIFASVAFLFYRNAKQ